MVTQLYLLIGLMILGSIIALELKDLLSAVISLGIVGFSLTLAFLILQAPDLAIVQIVVETLSLVILIAAILKTTREDTNQGLNVKEFSIWAAGILCALFLIFANQSIGLMSPFGFPNTRMAQNYLTLGVEKTGAVNIVAAIILDFRGYDTLGEATVLFTSVMGVLATLRLVGRKK